MVKFALLLALLVSVPAYATDCFNNCVQPVVVQKVQAISHGYAVQHHALNHLQFVAPLNQYAYVQVAPQIAEYTAGVQQLHASPSYKEYLADRANYIAWLEMKVSESKVQEQKAKSTILTQKCGQCHGAQLDDPKAGFRLLESGNSADTVVESLKQIAAGTMPPKGGLTAEDKAALMNELLASKEAEDK